MKGQRCNKLCNIKLQIYIYIQLHENFYLIFFIVVKVILTNGGLTISECHAQQHKLILQENLTYR